MLSMDPYSSPSEATRELSRLLACGVLSELDYHFALALEGISQCGDEDVLLAAALASRAVQHGHVCVDLARLESTPLLDANERPVVLQYPDLELWRTKLESSPLVRAMPSLAAGSGTSTGSPAPLVLDGHRLYLTRYALYERALCDALLRRVQGSIPISTEVARKGIAGLFPDDGSISDQQQLAACLSLLQPLTIISGGPGTGKTTTVARILALIQEQHFELHQRAASCLLLAPTGKAAQRLTESLRSVVAGLELSDATRSALEIDAMTIHRALGYQPHAPTRFLHDAGNPLSQDFVLVDEASMVDLALMTKLVAAIPAQARLVLLGDKDQLASVEAGAILGDIFNSDVDCAYSPQLCERLDSLISTAQLTPAPKSSYQYPLADHRIHLTRSYRYDADSGIGRLAAAVNAGDAAAVIEQLGAESSDVDWHRLDSSTSNQSERVRAQRLAVVLCDRLVDGLKRYFSAEPVEERLACIADFRVLCAHRRGLFGAETLGRLLEAELSARGLIQLRGEFYDYRPILVTRNDYQMDLFNGDIGVVAPNSTGSLRAWFPGDAGPREFAPARLPQHETVFAMTVHKSQGSEFSEVALVLPERSSPILTRELLYTGVTRARRRVEVFASQEVIEDTVARRIERASGLREALWQRPG